MPRIEIINGDTPSPTVDLCRPCALELSEGETVPEWLERMFPVVSKIGEHDEYAEIGSTDVEHPPYSSEYVCEHCGVPLKKRDNHY